MIYGPNSSCRVCGQFLSPDAIFGYGQCFNCGCLGDKAYEVRKLQHQNEIAKSFGDYDDDEEEDEEDEEEEEVTNAVPSVEEFKEMHKNRKFKITVDLEKLGSISIDAVCQEVGRLLTMNPVWLSHIIKSNMPVRTSLNVNEYLETYWNLQKNQVPIKGEFAD